MVHSYAPESSVWVIILGLALAGSALSWLIRKGKYDDTAGKVVNQCVSFPDGGLGEGKILKERVIKAMVQCEVHLTNQKKGVDTPKEDIPEDKIIKAYSEFQSSVKGLSSTSKEFVKERQKALIPVFAEHYVRILWDDFGGGFRKPRFPDDVLAYHLVLSPFYLAKGFFFYATWYSRRLAKADYSVSEIEYLTIGAVGDLRWVIMLDDEKAKAKGMKLWVSENLENWLENDSENIGGFGKKGGSKKRR